MLHAQKPWRRASSALYKAYEAELALQGQQIQAEQQRQAQKRQAEQQRIALVPLEDESVQRNPRKRSFTLEQKYEISK